MIIQLILPRTLQAEIDTHIKAAHPHEACGLLIGRREHKTALVEQAPPARNVAADPARQFEVDPKLLLYWHKQVRASGQHILGPWHSHPSGPARPSDRDCARITEDGQIWLIAGTDGFAAWRAALGPKAFQPISLQ